MQFSAGIHPFGGPSFTPLRVLLLDLENSPRQTRRALRNLVAVAGRVDLPLYPEVRPQGLDVLRAEDAEHLEAVVATVRPDIVIGGPVYKMAGGDPTDEKTARAVATLLDRLRTAYGFALIMESHCPYASGGAARPIRPYGASLWSRWPEFGIHLSAEGEIKHWRGQRDERAWPVMLQRGGTWPWTAVDRDRDLLWHEIRQRCEEAGRRLSLRDLAKATGKAKSSIERAVNEHRAEWDTLADKGAE